MSLHVINEAKRCLNCKNPLCRKGCPIGTAIPQMIQDFLNNNIGEAGKRLFENNPLSLVCSLVCDHEKQCEGHCILGKKGSSVHISSIENYISDNYLDRFTPQPQPSNGMTVAIVGSGPAGITIATVLANMGYAVTIFEAKDKIGGVMRYGIPGFRLPKDILDRLETRLTQMGVLIRPNVSVGESITVDDFLRDGYKSIFIGTGVWQPNSLHIKGETLGNVHFAIDYLSNPDVYRLGRRVTVIGAGNSAIDVARTAMRHGCDTVTVVARKPYPSASKHEVEYAEVDGVRFQYCLQPVEITMKGAIFRKMEYDAEGNGSEIPGLDELLPSDSVIVSTGQVARGRIVNTSKGIEVGSKGLIITDEMGSTTRPGVFAAGDVVLGAKTVVEAVHYSKRVALAMHGYMHNSSAQ